MGKTLEEWADALVDVESLDPESITSLKADIQAAAQKRTALQTEFDALNHMLTHQPPSAWAKREKKYHDDKKTWDAQAADFQRKMKRLQDEVQVLKDNNRAVVLQEQVQDLEALLKAARKESAETKATLEKTSRSLKVLEEDHAKLQKSHQESVKEAVGVRMSMRKMEEQLSAKTAEAAAESNRANEASRLLQSLRVDHNESSLKSDGLKEQLEAVRTNLAAAQKKAASDLDALRNELQEAREQASSEASKCAEAAAKSRELGSQLAAMQAEHGEMSAAAKDAEAARAAEARASLTQLNDAHQAELTSVKRQILGLEDRCQSLANEKTELTRQLADARKQHEADLLAAHTAAAAAADSVAAAAAASGSPAAAAAVAPPPPVEAAATPAEPAPAADARASASVVDTSPQHVSVSAAAEKADVGAAPRGDPQRQRRTGAPRQAAPESSSISREAAATAFDAASSGAPPHMPDAATARSAAVNGDASLPKMDLAPIDVPRSAHREPEAGPPLMIDVPQIKGGLVVDWNDPNNVSIAKQISTWNRVCRTVLPPSETAALIASGHAAVLSDTLTALDRESVAADASRMQAVACKIASTVPMASRPTEYAGGNVLPPMRGLPNSATAVLRAAARANAGRAVVSDEMDAAALTREAAGEADVAAAFARAMATENAHQDRTLVAVANAVTLAQGVAHTGQSLSRARVGLLRAAAFQSATGDSTRFWKNLAADEDFLEAFSVAMVASSVPAPNGDSVPIPQEQRLLFQAAAAAVLSTPEPSGGGSDGEGGEGGDGGRTGSPSGPLPLVSSMDSGGVAASVAGGSLDLSGLPNNPSTRAMREYAAQCETTVQVHQAQVERLMRQLDDKDRELAAMEETLQLVAPEGFDGERMIRPDLSRSDTKRLESLQSWMSLGHNRSAERIKALEAQLLIAEQNATNYQAKLQELGLGAAELDAMAKPTSGESLILSGDEDNYLTSLVVKLKVDLAETHGELMSSKRALARSIERENKLAEKVAMLEQPMPSAASVHAPQRRGLFPARSGANGSAFSESAGSPMGAFDTHAHDELAAPEIEIGGTGEL